MALNNKSIEELRKEIEKEVSNVPNGQRIHIDKELLESLLFDIVTDGFNVEKIDNPENNKLIAKHIVWSGPFLSRIDLSEVSFDDVIWNPSYSESKYFVDGKNRYESADIDSIDLSNTNAKIDFSKSFDAKYMTPFRIKDCNFANVDLSNNSLDFGDCEISFSDLSNTGLRIDLNSINTYDIYDSNLSGTNLSGCELDDDAISDVDWEEKAVETRICNCNLSNTGLNIISSGSSKIHSEVDRLVEKGYLDCCYIDGNLVNNNSMQSSFRTRK